MYKNKPIKHLHSFDKPRERLKELGPQNLTNAELLAILLSTGTKRRNVVSLSKAILKKYPVEFLSRAQMSELTKINGLGEIKAGKIIAAVELGIRSIGQSRRVKISGVEDVIREVNDIRNQEKEHLVALYLNARSELLLKQTIGIGSLNQNIIEPRDVFADALKNPCAAIILVHNHPSDDPDPSDQDIIFSKKLVEAGKLLGVKVLDHIIVTSNKFCSLKGNNLM